MQLEGCYFCFDKHEAKRRNGAIQYRDGKRGLVIEISERFGHPSIVAYKVLQAVFRKVTLEGKPYPDTVALSYRELGRLVGCRYAEGRNRRDLCKARSLDRCCRLRSRWRKVHDRAHGRQGCDG